MEPQNFSLVDLVPSYDTFTDTDGAVYHVKAATMFSAEDFARLRDLQTEIQRIQAQVASQQGVNGAIDPEAVVNLLPGMQQAMDGFLRMVVIDIPEERLGHIQLQHKLAFMQWWQTLQQQRNPQPPPNRQTRRAVASPRKQRLPSSSRSTGSARK